MKNIFIIAIIGFYANSYADDFQLADAKSTYQTKLINKESEGFPVEKPPKDLFDLIEYRSPIGQLPAYISKPESKHKKHPAIIWIIGGFSNGISNYVWSDHSPQNDQSASIFRKKGIITMYASLRGGNENPGFNENFYGEVDDIIAAAKHLATLEYVDANRIYLGGHSTGGTLALLVAESTSIFRAIFALGATGNVSDYGQESLNYDISIKQESDYRAPIRWLDSITSPTFLFEGEGGNVYSLFSMQNVNKNKLVHFYPIFGYNHFSIIQPLSSVIADKILLDDKQDNHVAFDKDKLLKDINKSKM
ncbi:MAG: prolyl oligopeptidase family serine peptidase [Alcanivoracaceae bacterium]|nr:prolyl oligopeptidase family serine peptidase [Alcanivoracaceae bacterium]